MFVVKWITFALWSNIFVTGRSGFKLELTPLNPAVHVGEDLKLTCSANSCPVNVTFTWRTLLDKVHGGETENQPNVSRLLIRNTTVEHNINVVCKATCEGTPLEKTSEIHVYSFPQDPVLPKIMSLRANQKQRLSCTVHNVYPLERLKIEWLLGDKHVEYSADNFDGPYDCEQNYSSVLNYTHSVDNLGKNITCKATLKLKNGFKETRSSTVEYGPGTITVSRNNASIKLGEHLEITCHADGNPKPTIVWRKQEKTDPAPLSQNGKLILNNASWSQAGWYQCTASNAVGSQQMMVKVIVLVPPSIPKIQLSRSGEIEEGENITIYCSSDGRPAKLMIYKQSQNATTGSPSESVAVLNMPSIQKSDTGIYICEAKNDIGTKKSTINITVKAQQNVFMPDLPIAIVPAIGSVTAAGLLIRHCRKKARGSFNLELN